MHTAHYGKVGCNTIECTAALLYSDWLCFFMAWYKYKYILKLTHSFDLPRLFCRTITRDDLVEYISKHYSAPRMVLAAAGGNFS